MRGARLMSKCEQVRRKGNIFWGDIWYIPWFQYAVMAVPAGTVPVSWRAPEVPSSLQAIVVDVASVIGLL